MQGQICRDLSGECENRRPEAYDQSGSGGENIYV